MNSFLYFFVIFLSCNVNILMNSNNQGLALASETKEERMTVGVQKNDQDEEEDKPEGLNPIYLPAIEVVIEVLKNLRNQHIKQKRMHTFGSTLQNDIVKLQLELGYVPTGLPDYKIWEYLTPQNVLHGSYAQGYHILAINELLKANNALTGRPKYYDYSVYDEYLAADVKRFNMKCDIPDTEGSVLKLTYRALIYKNCQIDDDARKFLPIMKLGSESPDFLALKFLMVHKEQYSANTFEDQVEITNCPKHFEKSYETLVLWHQYMMNAEGLMKELQDDTHRPTVVDAKGWELLTQNVTITPREKNWDNGYHVDALTSLLVQRNLHSWWWVVRNTGKYQLWMRDQVVEWQKKHDLPANGIVDSKTWSSLIHHVSEEFPIDDSTVIMGQHDSEFVRASCLLHKHFFKINGYDMMSLPKKYW